MRMTEANDRILHMTELINEEWEQRRPCDPYCDIRVLSGGPHDKLGDLSMIDFSMSSNVSYLSV